MVVLWSGFVDEYIVVVVDVEHIGVGPCWLVVVLGGGGCGFVHVCRVGVVVVCGAGGTGLWCRGANHPSFLNAVGSIPVLCQRESASAV